MNLTEAEISDIVVVKEIEATGQLRRRFFDLGIIEGTKMEVLYESPFGDPTAYLIRGTVIAIRKEDGKNIIIAS